MNVGGRVRVPDHLEDLEPAVFVPVRAARDVTLVNLVFVVVDTPQLAAPIAEAIKGLLAAQNPQDVSVHTSERLVELRQIVQGQLGAFSRGLVLALLTITALLVALLLYSLVLLRRRDFGRRRAIGASRGFIVGLLITQTVVTASVGTMLGLGVANIFLFNSQDPLPGFEFQLALAVLAIATPVVASSIPALIASRREPIRELRVP